MLSREKWLRGSSSSVQIATLKAMECCGSLPGQCIPATDQVAANEPRTSSIGCRASACSFHGLKCRRDFLGFFVSDFGLVSHSMYELEMPC